jgi:uncharacterized protein YukE
MVDVKMDYNAMEEMSAAFGRAKSTVETTKSQMTKVAKMLQDGALVGQAGSALGEAINNMLVKKLNLISEKMGEEQKDIKDAVTATRDGVSKARNRFTN